MAEEDDFVRITLRLPAALHARLNEVAAKKKSMNAEIIERLEASFAFEKPFADHDILTKILNEKYGAREAASNAAQIALHGYSLAMRASASRENEDASKSLNDVMSILIAIVDDPDPYNKLIDCRNWIVHHSKEEDIRNYLLDYYSKTEKE